MQVDCERVNHLRSKVRPEQAIVRELVVHPDKSVFIPSQVITVLGFVINTVTMTIYLMAEKSTSVQQICQTLLQRQTYILFRIMLRPAGFRLHSFMAGHQVITV